MAFEQVDGLCFERIKLQPIDGLDQGLPCREMTVKSADPDTGRLGDCLQRHRFVTGRKQNKRFSDEAIAIFRGIGASWASR